MQFNYFKQSSHNQKNNPVLYLPGFKASSNNCGTLAKMIATNHDFYGLDFPGINNTKIINSPLQIQELIDYTVAFIEDKKLENITIIAHSMGGLVANFVSQKISHKIKNIILISPLNPFVFHLFNEWKKYFFANNLDDQWKLIEMLYANCEKMLQNDSFKSGLIKRFQLEQNNQNNTELIALFDSINNCNIQNELLAIYHQNTIPTLVILGDQDRLYNQVNQLELFKNNYKNAIIDLVEEVGHVAIIENPELVFKKFQDFNT